MQNFDLFQMRNSMNLTWQVKKHIPVTEADTD